MSYLDDAWMRGAIDCTKKHMSLTKDVARGQVFDFSFAAKALGRGKMDYVSRFKVSSAKLRPLTLLNDRTARAS